MLQSSVGSWGAGAAPWSLAEWRSTTAMSAVTAGSASDQVGMLRIHGGRPAGGGSAGRHHYTEHYPPDPTSMCFWLKNRRPDRWRDVQNIDHAVGVYHISEAPMTEEEWIKHTSNAAQLELEATHSDATSVLPGESNEKRSN